MYNAITEPIRTSLLIIGALFPLVNSPENIPIFLGLTEGFSARMRALVAWKIAFNSFVLLLICVLIGTHVLSLFGISLPVVQVAGGMVLVAAGWNLLDRPDDDKAPDAHGQRAPSESYLSKQAFYPLTMPLTVGPGSASVAIALGANRPQGKEALWALPVAAVLGCAFLALTIYLVYRFAEPVGEILGEARMNIVVRFSSFILLSIGVQIVVNGIRQLLPGLA